MTALLDPRMIAWAAGYFEGEGAITHNRAEGASLCLSLPNTDLDRLEQFKDAVGGGSICKEAPRSERYKPAWCWRAYGYEAERIGLLLYPWLGPRRRARFDELKGARDEHIAWATRPRPCVGCGRDFRPKMHANASRQMYCDSTCQNRSGARRQRKRIRRWRVRIHRHQESLL